MECTVPQSFSNIIPEIEGSVSTQCLRQQQGNSVEFEPDPRISKKELLADIAEHKSALESLRSGDPDFLLFLQENDSTLLAFDSVDQDSADHDVPKCTEKPAALVAKQFEECRTKCSSSFGALRSTLLLYRAAEENFTCSASKHAVQQKEVVVQKKGSQIKKETKVQKRESAPPLGSNEEKQKLSGRLPQLHVSWEEDPALVQTIITGTINELGCDIHQLLMGHSSIKIAKDLEQQIPVHEYPGWKKLLVPMKVFWTSTIVIIETIGSNPDLEDMMMKNLARTELLVWLLPYARMLRKFVRVVAARLCDQTAESAKLHTFLLLKQLAKIVSQPKFSGYCVNPSNCLKGKNLSLSEESVVALDRTQETIQLIYQGYVKAVTKSLSWRNYSTYIFVENCIIELMGLPETSGVMMKVAWAAIKELAMHTRNANLALVSRPKIKKGKHMTDAKRERTLLQVLSWKFVLSCRLWTRFIARTSNLELKKLLYPLVTIIVAAMKLKLPSVQYSLYTLQCMKILCEVASTSQVFIPVAAQLFAMLRLLLLHQEKTYLKSLSKPQDEKISSGTKDVHTCLSLSASDQRNMSMLESIISAYYLVLVDHLGTLALHPSFPESTFPILNNVRQLMKLTKSEALKKNLKELLSTCQQSSATIADLRSSLDVVKIPVGSFAVFSYEQTSIGKLRARVLMEQSKIIGKNISAESTLQLPQYENNKRLRDSLDRYSSQSCGKRKFKDPNNSIDLRQD